MDRSTYPLLSEKKFVEIARRMLAGDYNNTKGFYNDLTDFLRTGGDTVQTKEIINACGIALFSEHHLLQCIYKWQNLKGISGLRQDVLH